jgi:hypothetical protein
MAITLGWRGLGYAQFRKKVFEQRKPSFALCIAASNLQTEN